MVTWGLLRPALMGSARFTPLTLTKDLQGPALKAHLNQIVSSTHHKLQWVLEYVTRVRKIISPSLSFVCFIAVGHHQHHVNSSGIHVTLHHPRSPCSPAPRRLLDFSDVLFHDESRVRALVSRLTKSHTTRHHKPRTALDPAAVSVPLNPGTSIGVGNYVTKIGLGTPSVDYVMVIDTGSSLSWLQCSPCKISCHDQVGAIFDPSTSATYRAVPCSATECGGLQSATLNPSGCTKSNVCVYEASYGDSSFSVGYLGRDTLSLGSSPVLPGFVYGCGQDNEGLFGKSAGLLGLAKNKLSLLSQLSPKFGSSFSYCLPTTSAAGFLSIGSYDPSKYTYTPMLSNSLDSTLYFLQLVGITVAGKSLPVSASSYTGTPTIIDSGTVISRLPSDVYAALSKAVVAALANYPQAAPYSILDTCFKGSAKGVAAPEVSLTFQGGAALKLPARNVLIDVDGSTTCLAFAAAGGAAIIGNTQQQTFQVVYDVAGSKIGFAAGGCG